jgi:hypothetical protein
MNAGFDTDDGNNSYAERMMSVKLEMIDLVRDYLQKIGCKDGNERQTLIERELD